MREYVESRFLTFTEAGIRYNGLDRDYVHNVINHAESIREGNIHTNGIENFWSLLKRGLKGTYISVEPFHLFRYLDEQAFRYNNRKDDDGGRFMRVIKVSSDGAQTLTYKNLTGSPTSQPPRLVDRQQRGKRTGSLPPRKVVGLGHAERRQPIQFRLAFPAFRKGNEGVGPGSEEGS